MPTIEYLDRVGLEHFWEKICWQDRDLLDKITANSNRINEIAQIQGKIWVHYDTTAKWNAQPELVSERGIIYVYSDARSVLGHSAPRVKIGDGVTLLSELAFMDADIITAINNMCTVTQEEKNKWNDKVGCRMEETTLQFYKD